MLTKNHSTADWYRYALDCLSEVLFEPCDNRELYYAYTGMAYGFGLMLGTPRSQIIKDINEATAEVLPLLREVKGDTFVIRCRRGDMPWFDKE